MNIYSPLVRYQKLFVAAAATVFIITVLFFNPHTIGYWSTYWWMFPIALIVAIMVNTAGISGSALFVPFFILLFPLLTGFSLAPVDSVRLGLITESFGLTSSALAFFSFGLVDTVLARRAIVRALPFVLGGTLLVFIIPKSILYLVVAGLLLFSLALMRYEHHLRKVRTAQMHETSKSCSTVLPNDDADGIITKTDIDGNTYTYCRTAGKNKRTVGYGLGGIFQGATGFGIGELGIITMMLTRIPMRIAIGTSHMIVATTAMSAALLHFMMAAGDGVGPFAWNIPIMTVPAVIIGGQLAPYVAGKLSTKYLERFISILFIIIAISLIVLVYKG